MNEISDEIKDSLKNLSKNIPVLICGPGKSSFLYGIIEAGLKTQLAAEEEGRLKTMVRQKWLRF